MRKLMTHIHTLDGRQESQGAGQSCPSAEEIGRRVVKGNTKKSINPKSIELKNVSNKS